MDVLETYPKNIFTFFLFPNISNNASTFPFSLLHTFLTHFHQPPRVSSHNNHGILPHQPCHSTLPENPLQLNSICTLAGCRRQLLVLVCSGASSGGRSGC